MDTRNDPRYQGELFDLNDRQKWEGMDVYDNQGDKIGTVEDFYVDEQTRKPEWLQVKKGFFRGDKLIPITGVHRSQDGLMVPYTKDQVNDSPDISDDETISESEERMLYSHYGINYGKERSGTQLPEGGAGTRGMHDTGYRSGETRTRGADDAMTRSEEKLNIHKVRRPSELVRLKKRVVTDHVTKTVPVQREEVVVEREPITDANRDRAMKGPEIREGEHEVVLEREDVEAKKHVEPEERIRLNKQQTQEERRIEEDLRKERVDVEREGRDKRDRPEKPGRRVA
jgi:uncharacterized protein (TIGR02271 family)